MEGNKLKHSFVKKDKLPSDFINEWRNHINNHPQPFIIETSTREWETIAISRTVPRQFTELVGTMENLKRDMVMEIAQILYEGNFIEIVENRDYLDFQTRIIMRLNVERRQNVR